MNAYVDVIKIVEVCGDAPPCMIALVYVLYHKFVSMQGECGCWCVKCVSVHV